MPTKKAAPKKVAVKKAAIKPAVVKPADHTHAMLVALAYLIGFVTAYIAFALNDHSYNEKPKERLIAQEAVAYSPVRAVTTEDGLFMVNDGQQRVISAQLDEGELSFGYHRGIASASVSSDGSMIHYCAVMSDVNTCSHFVYVLSEDRVYPVSNEGTQLITSESVADAVRWASGNRLMIGDYFSVSEETPWMVE